MSIATSTQEGIPSTKDVITSMLKENTGRSILDSGGAYGRHFEQNQKVDDFGETEPYAVNVYSDHVSLTANVFHFLNEFLEYNEKTHEMNQQFREFATSGDMKNESWLFCANEWLENNDRWVNTYNRETILSQTLQYVFLDGDMNPCDMYQTEYIFLQVHNGCDVRGGYTAPVLFKMSGYPDYWIMKMQDFHGSCQYHYHDVRPHRFNFSVGHQHPDIEYEEPNEDRSFDPENDRVYCNHCIAIIDKLNKEEVGECVDDVFNFESDQPLSVRYQELVETQHEVENTPHEKLLEMAEINFHWTPSY